MGSEDSVPEFPPGAAGDPQQQQHCQAMRIGHQVYEIRAETPSNRKGLKSWPKARSERAGVELGQEKGMQHPQTPLTPLTPQPPQEGRGASSSGTVESQSTESPEPHCKWD